MYKSVLLWELCFQEDEEDPYIHTHKATVLCDVIMFPVYTSYFEVFLYEHASSHCSLLWYANALFTNKITLCCGFLSLYQA